jgi:thiol-disulfide isomerase/thioredoxin
MLAPKLEEMSKANPNVYFVKVDVDNNPQLAERFNISAMPTIHYFKNKELQAGVRAPPRRRVWCVLTSPRRCRS